MNCKSKPNFVLCFFLVCDGICTKFQEMINLPRSKGEESGAVDDNDDNRPQDDNNDSDKMLCLCEGVRLKSCSVLFPTPYFICSHNVFHS